MNNQLTYEEMAALMKSCAGLKVDPAMLADRPDALLADFGLDSLGLLAIVSELEQRYGTPITADADTCKTPQDLIAITNSAVTSGA
ncbi:acyl carrier protein [Streptomyces sp. LX-29]|uniref:acyl carrier protein n=1 Tax=unclassified Streptomyces TaxID=2593676 RepID=UPI001642BEFE|nr:MULTISPECIES: acyl carrier protein [unclassified Streptomyces]WFB11504.1 acyl carrier protein [Streptomyces sp. LX-29]